MIDLKFHCDIDASELAVQTNSAEKVLDEIKTDSMAGWVTLPEDYDGYEPGGENLFSQNGEDAEKRRAVYKEEYARIKKAAEKIQNDSDYLICIGIGGSYLGHRAIIDALDGQLKSNTKVLYSGNSISSVSLQKIFDEIEGKDFSINVISKSGTTTEPAIAFRIFKKKLIEKYGEKEAYHRIYATTDSSKGALYDEAVHNNYERFVVPDAVGGRYSVFTAVGLLPLAAAGVDLDKLLEGAREEQNGDHSNIYKYASARHILRARNFDLEVLASFEPSLEYFEKWWQQLFGESEGKENQGIFPAASVYTTDLHSLGQYMQQGRPNIFETIITFENDPVLKSSITVPKLEENLDGLKYLEGKDLRYINDKAEQATITAHSAHIPVIELRLKDLSEKSLGSLIYFFELSCALSAKFGGVNPFDQPGVEAYKNEMFRLLEKPGYFENA
ncbi:glucose-6-phosphate isomerase [Candidatus Saccharibacteria bacterium]|nr:glucose-6-phosphate isomerase [Candidatus Saccharibacteria bacterium]